jgi:tRNA threonylcarbamoyladenosine biosynthesis protein TsaB
MKPTILSIETSTEVFSVAIRSNGETLYEFYTKKKNSHSTIIWDAVNFLIDKSGIKINDIDFFALGAGPGSYTGLRIGFSFIHGLAYAQNKPFFAVNTLFAMAYDVNKSLPKEKNRILIPMIDARRMEVYTAGFRTDLTNFFSTTYKIIDRDSAKDLLNYSQDGLFFGNGAMKCHELLNQPNLTMIDNIKPKASVIAEIAEENFFVDCYSEYISYDPIYLKEFSIKHSEKQ